jgi:hypothetical protein
VIAILVLGHGQEIAGASVRGIEGENLGEQTTGAGRDHAVSGLDQSFALGRQVGGIGGNQFRRAAISFCGVSEPPEPRVGHA